MQVRSSRRRRRCRRLLALAAVAAASFGALPAQAADDDALVLRWKDGLKIESADGKVQAKIGGRIQLDGLVGEFDRRAEANLGVSDGSGVIFRRARINLDASFSDYYLKAEYDFAGGNGDANFRDVYIGLKNLPCASTLQAGHYKEPFSMEELASDNYTTFLERNLADNLTPARNTGIQWMTTPYEGRMSYALGGFRETGDFGDDYDNNDSWNVTTRLTGLPLANDDNTRLVHLGVAYSHKFTDSTDVLRFRARPGIGAGDRLFDTGAGPFPTNSVDLFGVEGAVVLGPLSVQAEYINALVDGTGGQHTVDFWGGYIETSFFVTPGDHRFYRRDLATFDRVKPVKPFSLKGGTGAVQLGVRYDHLDLEDENITGGQGFTVGPVVNWYLTNNLRIIANYIHGERDEDGKFEGGGMRLQVDY